MRRAKSHRTEQRGVRDSPRVWLQECRGGRSVRSRPREMGSTVCPLSLWSDDGERLGMKRRNLVLGSAVLVASVGVPVSALAAPGFGLVGANGHHGAPGTNGAAGTPGTGTILALGGAGGFSTPGGNGLPGGDGIVLGGRGGAGGTRRQRRQRRGRDRHQQHNGRHHRGRQLGRRAAAGSAGGAGGRGGAALVFAGGGGQGGSGGAGGNGGDATSVATNTQYLRTPRRWPWPVAAMARPEAGAEPAAPAATR